MIPFRSLLPFLAALTAAHAAAADSVVADFEGSDYAGWKTAGSAFGNGPAPGAVDGQMKVEGFTGKGLANSYHGGDDSTGTLTSPEFTLTGRYLNFLIGGGGFAGETCLNLLINGKVAMTATGRNVSPGGSERLSWETWDLAKLAGKKAVLQIVDQRKGTWGHLNVDQIEQSDQPKIADLNVTMKIDHRYLLWPIAAKDDRGGNARVFFEIDGRPFTFSDINLGASPNFWTFTDLANEQGKTLTLKTRIAADLLPAWNQVKLSDTYPGEDATYREPLRPQFHFTSRRGWINDPNGLIFADGLWHLFYQHNPYNHGWDNMHWGHATSPDLLHWTELPNAIYPGPEGTIFSGSAFLASKGNSALPIKGDKPAIVLAYTAEGSLSYLPGQPSLQSAAISQDGGKTFTKYDKNPLLGQYAAGNRDPKVFYYGPTEKWIMPIYLEGNKYGLFSSPNLTTWTAVSEYEIPGEAECPDLFELPMEGDGRFKRWIAWGANGKYQVGTFNGTAFKPASGVLRHYFGNAYAGQTYSNAPDGRRVHIGWMRDGTASFAGMPFNLQMTLPMDFTLRSTPTDVRLWIEPAKEVATLRVPGAAREWKDLEISAVSDPLADFTGELFEIDAAFEATDLKSPVGFKFFDREEALWNPADKTFSGAEGPQDPVDGVVRIHTFIDRVSMESFVNGTYVGRYIRQDAGKRAVKIIAEPGTRIRSLKITPLQGVWK